MSKTAMREIRDGRRDEGGRRGNERGEGREKTAKKQGGGRTKGGGGAGDEKRGRRRVGGGGGECMRRRRLQFLWSRCGGLIHYPRTAYAPACSPLPPLLPQHHLPHTNPLPDPHTSPSPTAPPPPCAPTAPEIWPTQPKNSLLSACNFPVSR